MLLRLGPCLYGLAGMIGMERAVTSKASASTGRTTSEGEASRMGMGLTAAAGDTLRLDDAEGGMYGDGERSLTGVMRAISFARPAGENSCAGERCASGEGDRNSADAPGVD